MSDTTLGKKWWELDSAMLHIIAMVLMLSDHMWGTIAGNIRLLTMIGRVAFPIFAFMIVEGMYHTSSVKKYMLRLLAFALISEIPFDFMMSGRWFSIYHQNVLWTFLMAILLILLLQSVKKLIDKLVAIIKNEIVAKIAFIVLYLAATYLVCGIGFIAGSLSMVDYYGGGVVTVIVLYVFHERKWWNFIIQLMLLYYINTEMIGGMTFLIPTPLGTFELCEQAIAVLAIIPMWLYKGRKGYNKKWFKYFCYGFYAGHMALLCIIRSFM